MMSYLKEKKTQGNWVAFQAWRPQGSWASPNSPKTSDTKNSRLAVYVPPCDDTSSVTLKTAVATLHLFRDKENHRVWLLARWPSAADGACPDTAFIPSRDLPGFKYTKQPAGIVSKLLLRLCNYLFSYNCRFSCIIWLTNSKLMLPHILNSADRSQKGGEWCPEKISGVEDTALLGHGQDMHRLLAWCTLQIWNTSDDCHSLALYTAMASR